MPERIRCLRCECKLRSGNSNPVCSPCAKALSKLDITPIELMTTHEVKRLIKREAERQKIMDEFKM